MPTGVNFGSDVKQLILCIIQSVECEKEGPVIASYNRTGRLEVMPGVSRATVFRLRNEMHSLEEKEEEEEEYMMKIKCS